MFKDKPQCSLEIIYQNKEYDWQDLMAKLQYLATQLRSDPSTLTCLSDGALAVISQDRFSVALLLLRTFFDKTCCYPISTSKSADYVYQLLEYSGARIVVSDKKIETSAKQLCLNELFKNIHLSTSDSREQASAYRCNPQELKFNTDSALLITTSGSITQPKIVNISYQNLVHHVQSFTQIIPLNSASIWLNCLPLEHIAGAMILYRCLFTDAAMLLVDNFDARVIWQQLDEYPVTHVSLVPLMLKRLLDHAPGKPPPSSLKYVLVGGDMLSKKLFQRARQSGWPVCISYGLSEACSTVAIGTSPEKLYLLPGLYKKINNKGELLLKGPMLMSGYLPADHNPMIHQNTWFNTHDLMTSKGDVLHFSGRADFRILNGGETIDPQLIEELISECPAINDVAVGKINHPDWGNTIVALVQGKSEELKIWAERHLDKKYRPRLYIESHTIPRNQLGKINRMEVQQIIQRLIK